jgi:hypothetical protein
MSIPLAVLIRSLMLTGQTLDKHVGRLETLLESAA